MKKQVLVNAGIFAVTFYSAVSQALIIESNVSVSLFHQVNSTYSNQQIGPQISIEPLWYSPQLIKTSDETAGGTANSQLVADTAGHNFIYSYGVTDWRSRDWWQPGTSLGEFKPFSYTSQTQLTRSALITNDAAHDVRLDFNYLINGGGIGYYLPDFAETENTYSAFAIEIIVNNQSVWFSGGSVYGDAYTQSVGGPQLYTYGQELNGEVFSWSHITGENFDTPMHSWQYFWGVRSGQLDLGILKPGESLELAYRYFTVASGNVTHCVTNADPEVLHVGCADLLASAYIGSGIWGSDVAPFDETSINAYSVAESSSLGLLMLSLIGLYCCRTKKNP